jgi:hypothetical protein
MSDHTDLANHLALLIAAPHPGEVAMYRDQAAMAEALPGRGLSADEILCLHGRLNRPLVTAFLQAASRRAVGWTDGLLFGDSEDVADDGHLFWDELFAVLALPAGVKLTLLPDL